MDKRIIRARKKIVRLVHDLGADRAFEALLGSILAELAGLGDTISLIDFINAHRAN